MRLFALVEELRCIQRFAEERAANYVQDKFDNKVDSCKSYYDKVDEVAADK